MMMMGGQPVRSYNLDHIRHLAYICTTVRPTILTPRVVTHSATPTMDMVALAPTHPTCTRTATGATVITRVRCYTLQDGMAAQYGIRFELSFHDTWSGNTTTYPYKLEAILHRPRVRSYIHGSITLLKLYFLQRAYAMPYP